MENSRNSKHVIVLLWALSILFTVNVMAQNSVGKPRTKVPTLEELIPGGEAYRYPENKWYQWYGDRAYLELGIDSIAGTWVESGAGVRAGDSFTAITLEEVNRLLED